MKKLLLAVIAALTLTSCQKDYYLEDLNEANEKIESLENRIIQLKNEVTNNAEIFVDEANELYSIIDSLRDEIENLESVSEIKDEEIDELKYEIDSLQDEIDLLTEYFYEKPKGYHLDGTSGPYLELSRQTPQRLTRSKDKINILWKIDPDFVIDNYDYTNTSVFIKTKEHYQGIEKNHGKAWYSLKKAIKNGEFEWTLHKNGSSDDIRFYEFYIELRDRRGVKYRSETYYVVFDND